MFSALDELFLSQFLFEAYFKSRVLRQKICRVMWVRENPVFVLKSQTFPHIVDTFLSSARSNFFLSIKRIGFAISTRSPLPKSTIQDEFIREDIQPSKLFNSSRYKFPIPQPRVTRKPSVRFVIPRETEESPKISRNTLSQREPILVQHGHKCTPLRCENRKTREGQGFSAEILRMGDLWNG